MRNFRVVKKDDDLFFLINFHASFEIHIDGLTAI